MKHGDFHPTIGSFLDFLAPLFRRQTYFVVGGQQIRVIKGNGFLLRPDVRRKDDRKKYY
jgi:hypothetical protein